MAFIQFKNADDKLAIENDNNNNNKCIDDIFND